jgi:hypothetical protein
MGFELGPLTRAPSSAGLTRQSVRLQQSEAETKKSQAESNAGQGTLTARLNLGACMTSPVNQGFVPTAIGWPQQGRLSASDLTRFVQQSANESATRNPAAVALTQGKQAPANRVTVGGVTVTKYPTPAELANASASPEALRKFNPTVYVLDDFVTGVIPVGSGVQRRVITHGDQTKAIVQLALPGVKVVRVDATDSNRNLTTGSRAAAIRQVIAQEAKIQNTSTPDLSRAFIVMPLGDSVPTDVPDEATKSAIAEFTKLGGTFYASAGNGLLNSTTRIPGIGIAYASSQTVGSAWGNNPQPAESLASGATTSGNRSISRVSTNPLGAGSTAYIAPGTLTQRFNPDTGSVEFQNAKGTWVPAIPADRVLAAPVTNADALNNSRAGRELTASDAKNFDAWQQAREKTALAAHRSKNGQPAATLGELTPQESAALTNAVRAEFLRRYGSNAVMSVEAYKVLADAKPGSDTARAIDRSLPSNRTAANTFISAENALINYQSPQTGQLQFFARDAGGILRSQPAYTFSKVSTSAATPGAAASAVLYRASQLERAQRGH